MIHCQIVLQSLENQVSESCRGGMLSSNVTDVTHTETDEIKDTVVVGNGDWINEGGSGESPEPPYLPAPDIKGCEEMMGITSGVLSLGAAELNRGGRDYRLRYCRRDPAGNMWTVMTTLLVSCLMNGLKLPLISRTFYIYI